MSKGKVDAPHPCSEFVPKDMVESVFRYEETPEIDHPLKPYCSHGNYYKNAKKTLKRKDVGKKVGKDVGKDEEGLEIQCVIMDYEQHDRAIAQIKLSHKMGDKYALNVLHVDNTKDESKAKVIYPLFDNTVSRWLEESKNEGCQNDKYWLKNDLIPITRKLWKLLGKMEENGIQTLPTKPKGEKIYQKENNNQGYWMPLINKVPMVLNLSEGKGNLDVNYPVQIIKEVLGDESSRPLWLGKALTFWKSMGKRKLSLHDACEHPALYNSAEKLGFLALFYQCTVDHDLQPWLDKQMEWFEFYTRLSRSDHQEVYIKILYHRNSKRYSSGSDVVRYTRNALAHFQETYKLMKGKPWDGGEIAEILDEDLAVCSTFYIYARKIIENDKPPRYIKPGNWDKAKQKLKAFLDLVK